MIVVALYVVGSSMEILARDAELHLMILVAIKARIEVY